MALTLRDVVDNQTQLRASAIRRDTAASRAAAASDRQRFSLEASDRQDAAQARSRAASSAKAEAVATDSSPKSREASSDRDRPAAASSASEAASRPDPSPRSTGSKPAAAASPENTMAGKTSPQKAEGESSGKAVGGTAGASAQSDGTSTAPALTGADANSVVVPIVTAVVTPPTVAAPASPTSNAPAEAVAEAELGAVAGGGKGIGATDTGLASTKGPAIGAKEDFQLALADSGRVSSDQAAAVPSATQSVDTTAAAVTATSTSPASDPKAAAAASPTTPAAAPIPLGAVPMTIGLRALGETNRFEIRLDPKELGRIDVSIDIDKDSGTVGARLVVDRPETLALLHRDSATLQQALAQTGLDASAGISLSLRGDGAGQGNGNAFGANGQQQGNDPTQRAGRQAATDPSSIDLVPLRSLNGLGRVDIRI